MRRKDLMALASVAEASRFLREFADDTTLAMSDIAELPAVEKGIDLWCKATGMKENLQKRKGLAMGAYRGTHMPTGIRWVEEGSWAISLGVPVGNELDTDK